jgi:hypothetical protein
MRSRPQAFIADYVSGELTTPNFGLMSASMFTGAGILVGAVVALTSDRVSHQIGRSWVMGAGIVAFTAPAITEAIRVRYGGSSHLSGAQMLLPISYFIAYGIGRAVFDSAVRAMCTVLFPHALAQIFALVSLLGRTAQART